MPNKFCDCCGKELSDKIQEWGGLWLNLQNRAVSICSGQIVTFIEAILRVKEAPAVDAVEVVRCRDCRMYRPESVFFPAYCTVSGQQKTDDDFCSWGERMEEDAVD